MNSIPPAVRILPMNFKKEFSGYNDLLDIQKRYFQKKLPNKNGHFEYRERGLNSPEGTVVLFQCNGKIISSGIFTHIKKYTRPTKNGYRGHLKFDVNSIRIFDPIGPEILRRIWPNFKRFSNVKISLDPKKYPIFEKTLTSQQHKTISERILEAVSYHFGSRLDATFSREVIRKEIEIDKSIWNRSYNPIFQAMRADEPGGAPSIGKRYKNIFRQIHRGNYCLTDYGKILALEYNKIVDGSDTSRIKELTAEVEEQGYFSGSNDTDEKERVLQEIVRRRGQQKFRENLIVAYNGMCAVTGCDVVAALEAAHILPYSGPKSNHVSNGLLLRSDIHVLFDLNLLGINPKTLTVNMATQLQNTNYAKHKGKHITVPSHSSKCPNKNALKRRWKQFESQ